MTIQAITGGGFKLPAYKRADLTPMSGGAVGILLDASGEKAAVIFRAPKAGDIHKIGFRTGTVTTGDTLKVSFQDLAATGFPDETADQYRTVSVADGNDDTWFTTGILSSDGTDSGTKRTVTKGQELAVVLEFNAYVAGNLYIANCDGVGSAGLDAYPYVAQKVGAGPTWTKINSGASIPCIALEYSDGSFAFIGALPITSHTAQSFKSDTVGADEYALRFTVPFPMRIVGMGCVIDADGNADFILYEGTTQRAGVSIDPDMRASSSVSVYEMLFDDGPYTLSKDTVYHASVKPTTTTAVVLNIHNFNSAGILDSVDGGQAFHLATRVDGGAWSYDTAKRPVIWLIVDGFDDATGGAGGGLLIHPGMTGGING